MWQDFSNKVNFGFICVIPSEVYFEDLMEVFSVPADVMHGSDQSTVRLILSIQ